MSGTDVTAERHMAAQLESTGQRDQLTGLLSPSSLARSVADALVEIAGSQDGLAYGVRPCGLRVWNDSLGPRCRRRDLANSRITRPTVCWAGVRAVREVGRDSFGILLRDPAPPDVDAKSAWMLCPTDCVG